MDTQSDQQLLRDYAQQGSQPAFEEVVRRHIDLVYSVALRIVRHAEGAEDVTQCAFTVLAQKAGQVAEHPVLSGWLHRTARNLAAKAVRSDVRRRAREKEAAMNRRLADQSDSPWDRVAPHLDAALGELGDADRVPLLLRYFERKSAREIGQTLGINEEAAQKRVSRAVERLRDVLARRDVSIGTTAMVLILTTNVVQAAPPTLSAAVVAAAGSASGTSAAAASQGFRSFSKWTRPALALVACLAFFGLAAAVFWQPRPAAQRTPPNPTGTTMQISIASVMVDDQEKARRFYTDVLGLVTKIDVPAGGARWLTVVSPDEPDGTEMLLEPMGFPAAGTYQKALFDAGIPWTSFAVGDLQREYARMKQLGASFKVEPTAALRGQQWGGSTIAVFDDTSGNLIRLFQPPAAGGTPAPFRVKIKFNKVLVKDQERALRF